MSLGNSSTPADSTDPSTFERGLGQGLASGHRAAARPQVLATLPAVPGEAGAVGDNGEWNPLSRAAPSRTRIAGVMLASDAKLASG